MNNSKKEQNAIILAAGYGIRMIPINTEIPKGLIHIEDEVLIERLIKQLHEAGIYKITIVVGYMKELNIPGAMPYPGISASASEDFASIAERVPSTFMYLSAGYTDERGQYPAHNPKAQFNEDVCPIGSSCLAHCATQWLKNNK